MNHRLHVAHAPPRPVMLYDSECRFCKRWILRWQQITGDAVDYLPFQDSSVAEQYPELPREKLEQAVHLIETDGAVSSGAEAVFRALATNPSKGWLLRLYERSSFLRRVSERFYAFVAAQRTLFGWLPRLLWGKHVERPEYSLARWVFLRALGLIYLIAFISLEVQIIGLVGRDGILPATDLMSQAHAAVEARGMGIERFHLLPTLCWFNASDGFLRLQCVAGVVLALAVVAGIAQPACLAMLWVLYLSLATVCQEFLGFQWDNLLLEVGLLAIFFAPFQFWPRPSRERPPSRTVLWLLRLLLFKLMFLSGVVKLVSGDEAWRKLTALTFHYGTQPLPTWIGWYAYQFPLWIQKGSCALMFVVELAVPFLIFLPRRARMVGAGAIALLQLAILLTGNYTFFNWLTIALCLLWLDDFALASILPRKLTSFFDPVKRAKSALAGPGQRWRQVIIMPLAIVVVSVSAIQILAVFRPMPGWAAPVVEVHRWLTPFRSLNSYGLFAVMTRERPEIIVEGSNDGSHWKAYEFPYKPGDLKRRPAFVAPYQPRLDWQMWFAALGDVRQNPWFVHFCVRLLQGSPDVLALLEKNPFPDQPPKYVRARLYEYRFTTIEERRLTGAWWKREPKGEYLSPISLEMLAPSGRD